MSETTEEKLDFKRLLPIFFIVFVDLMGLTIIIPILPYYALAFDATPFTIGLIGASYPLMQLIGGPILGSLSDRYGRKPVLAVAQVGTFLSLLLLGSANALWMLFAARLLDGITGANLPTVQAAISDVTTPKTRAQGFGLIGAAFGLGFIFGPALSGAALAFSGNNYSAPAFLAAGFAFVSVMLTTFIFKETLPPEKRGQQEGGNQRTLSPRRILAVANNPAIRVLFLLIFVQQLIFFSFQLMFAPFTLNRFGLNSVGNTVFFVLIGIISVIVQGGLIGPLTKRFGERRLVIVGFGLLGIGLVLNSLAPQQGVPWYSQEAIVAELEQQSTTTEQITQLDLLPPQDNLGIASLSFFIIGLIPLIIGASLIQPSVSSLITQRVSPTEVGSILGLNAALLSLANVLGPLWGGAAFDFIAPAAPFMIGGVVMLLLVPLAVRGIVPIKEISVSATS